MQPQKDPILVVGTGAMASLFAARLATSGEKVRMLGTWVESIETLNRSGVRLIEADGREHEYPVQATDDPNKCAGSKFAIILVKSYQTERVAQQLKVCLADDGIALTLQNGLDNDKTLAKSLGIHRVVSGVTTVGATLIEPGIVRDGGTDMISIGVNERIQTLVDILIQAGFEVETVADSDSLVWGKLVINASINPLTAILNVPNGYLLTNPTARNLMGLIANETARVSFEMGVKLPYLDPVLVVESVAQKTALNISSMLKDVLQGGPTEIDAINGAIVHLGDAVDTPVQYNRTMWLLVKAIEANAGIRKQP